MSLVDQVPRYYFDIMNHMFRHNPMRWGRAGAGIMFFCEDEVLLTLRSERVAEPLTWGVSGGAIGSDRWISTEDEDVEQEFEIEDFWQGALQETSEELFGGEQLLDIKYFDYVVYKEGNFTYYTFLVQIDDVERRSWNLQCNWECNDHRWFPSYALPYGLDNGLHFGVKYIVKQRQSLFRKNLEQSLSDINLRGLPIFRDFQLRESDVTLYRKGSESEFSEFTFVPRKYYFGEYYGTPRMDGGRGSGFGSGQYSFCTPGPGRIEIIGPRRPFVVTAKQRGKDPAHQFFGLAKSFMCLAETWAGVHDWSWWLRSSAYHIHPSYETPNWTEIPTTPDNIDDTALMFMTMDLKMHQNGDWWRVSDDKEHDYELCKQNIINACTDWSIHRMVHPLNIYLSRYGFDGIIWGEYTIQYADNGDFGCLLFPPITYDGELVGFNPPAQGNTYMLLPTA